MNRFLKILILIASLIGLLFSLGLTAHFITIPVITNFIGRLHRISPWTDIVFMIFSVKIGLCFVVLIIATLLAKVTSRTAIAGRDRGILRLSKQTIISTVRYSFADIYEIGYYKIKAKINKDPGKIRIRVKLAFTNSAKIAELTESVHSKIDNALQSSLGIQVAEINIDVLGVKQKNEIPPTSNNYHQASDL